MREERQNVAEIEAISTRMGTREGSARRYPQVQQNSGFILICG